MQTCARVPGAPSGGTAEVARWALPSASPAPSCLPPTPAGLHVVSEAGTCGHMAALIVLVWAGTNCILSCSSDLAYPVTWFAQGPRI
jgi:hypothetical protein